jgi:diadenosine tetraphosphatase ApaH/serine/threonine PP2A family protein phosphatase
MEALTEENTRYLGGLEKSRLFSFGLACHGTPESTTNYLGLHFQARALLRKMRNGSMGGGNVILFGHTHKRKVWRMDVRGKVAPIEIPEDGRVELSPEEFYLVNPGAVGQPRSGDPRSSYLLFDTNEKKLEFRLVEYDLALATGKIVDAGLPEFFARRLVDGV